MSAEDKDRLLGVLAKQAEVLKAEKMPSPKRLRGLGGGVRARDGYVLSDDPSQDLMPMSTILATS